MWDIWSRGDAAIIPNRFWILQIISEQQEGIKGLKKKTVEEKCREGNTTVLKVQRGLALWTAVAYLSFGPTTSAKLEIIRKGCTISADEKPNVWFPWSRGFINSFEYYAESDSLTCIWINSSALINPWMERVDNLSNV